MAGCESRKHIDRDELDYFVNKIAPWWSDGNIFFACRKMQREARDQNITITNPVEIYHWIQEIRDQIKSKKNLKA